MTVIDYRFFRSIRLILGDLDPAIQKYPDTTLSDAVKTVLCMNKMPEYSLTVDESGIQPDITDPNDYALIVYYTVKLFVDPQPDRYELATRAFREKMQWSASGGANRFLATLEMEIHKLENGDMFSGWQNYFAWLSGMAGLPLAEVLTDMHVTAPLWNTTLTREGLRTIPDNSPPAGNGSCA